MREPEPEPEPEGGEPRRPGLPDDGPGPASDDGRGYPRDDGSAHPLDDDWPVPPDDDPNRVPGEWELEGPVVSLSLGDAADLDPALLAAMLGPDGLGGQSLGAVFGQDKAADALRPGPILAALTEQAVSDLVTLSDDQLTGALQAARRLETRAAWQQTMVVAELARRRAAEVADAKARKVPRGRRPGEFPDEELAAELLITRNQAAARIEADLSLSSRLPRTLAGMAAGVISGARADTIAAYTGSLSDADAAYADEILAAAAPGLRIDQLARKAAALEMKLDPEAARIRKEHAKDTRQRVEVRRELSGNASIAGRELDTADAMASKAYIDALAVRLRNSGAVEGTLSAIRVRILTELTQGRNPLDLIATKHPLGSRPAAAGTGHPGDPDYPCCPGDPDDPGPGDCDSPDGPGYTGPDGRPSWNADEAGDARYDDDPPGEPARRGPLRPGDPAPLPANINLLVPVGTLIGWSAAPTLAGGLGLLDPTDTRAIVAAASRHPRTRWCMTIIGPDGTAVAHGCSRGQHPWAPPPPGTPPRSAPPGTPTPPPGTSRPGIPPPGTSPRGTPPPGTSPRGAPLPGTSRRGTPLPGTSPRGAPPLGTSPRGTSPPPSGGPDVAQALHFLELLGRLKITPEPIARGQCDHRHAEDRYTPSRTLRHLIRARSATCDAPGCGAQAVHCDLDHTVPWPEGATCECQLGPKCRRHHRAKQAPGWHLKQPEPGLMRWTLPNSRTHTTSPTVYDL